MLDVPVCRKTGLAAVNELLRWAADRCVWGTQVVDHSGLDADALDTTIFAPRRGGVSCGGMAVFFADILRRHAFDARFLHTGIAGTGFTHVTVTVQEGGRRYVFDPLYSGRYVTPEGEDLDFDSVLAGAPFRFALNPMNRTIVTHESIARRRRFRWKRDGIVADWEDETNEHGFVAAHGFAYTPAFFRFSQQDDMIEHGLTRTDDIIVQLYRRGNDD